MLGKCKNCGAETEYAADCQSVRCQFCDTVYQIEKPEEALPAVVDLVIPLAVTREDLENRAYGYMASGKYTRDDVLEEAVFVKRELFYVPAYQFDVSYEASWTASFGYDRREPYTDYRTVYRDGRSHQEAYTAYRTVTDWRPANGVDSGIFSVSTYAGTRLDESDLAPCALIPITVARAQATAFDPDFTKGVESEAFSVAEVAARDSLKGEINSEIDSNVRRHAQGDHQRDWRWTARMSHTSRTLYVPICHAVFDYRGSNYHFWTQGAGGGTFRATSLPSDEKKIRVIRLGFIPAGFAAAGFAFTATLPSFNAGGLVAVGIAAGFAFLRWHAIVEYSKTVRQSLLTQIRASASTMNDLNDAEKRSVSQAFQRPVRPLLARTGSDKFLLPALGLLLLLGAVAPAYLPADMRVSQPDDQGATAAAADGQAPPPVAQNSNPPPAPNPASPDNGANAADTQTDTSAQSAPAPEAGGVAGPDAAPRSSDQSLPGQVDAEQYPYIAVLTCGAPGFPVQNFLRNCMQGPMPTQLEVTNGDHSDAYSSDSLPEAWPRTRRGLEIPLASHFEVRIQNASDTLTLGVQIIDKSGNVLAQRRVGQSGVIVLRN